MELREAGEEVQVVDSHRKEVEQLEQLEIEGQQQRRAQTKAKREELEGRVLECGEEVKRSEG